MYEIGEVLVYTTYGICRVSEITEMKLGPMVNKYYQLLPLTESKTKLTVPVDNPMTKLRLHPLLDKDTILELIHEIPFLETTWIEKDNDRKLKFSEIIKSGDRKETIRVIKAIRKHIIDIKDKGRKLHATDEAAMKDAEKLIVDEFSYVLEMPKDQLVLLLNTELEK